MIMDTEIPANATAKIFIENTSADNVKESKGNLSGFEGLLDVEEKDGGVLIHVESGAYHFRWTVK